MNSGKSTVSKILVDKFQNAVFIEVDDLMSDEEQKSLGLAMREGWKERHKRLNAKLKAFQKSREYDVIIFAYPIADNTYQDWKAMEDKDTRFMNITLAPSLNECLKNRGTRSLNDWEKKRIREMYAEGYQNRPYADLIINNDHQTPDETAEVIKEFLDHALSLKQPCNAKDYLGKTVSVLMDRPMGSKHPKHGFIYPVNYGYIPGTLSGDGEELDAYVLGVEEPRKEFTGKCVAIIHRTDDNDDKLVVVPEKVNFSDKEIEKQVAFQEKWFHHVIVRER